MLRTPLKQAYLPAVHLLGLFAIAVAQPLLHLLGGGPEFFVAHRCSPGDVVAVAVLVVLAIPLLLAVPVVVSGYFGAAACTRMAAGLGGVLVAAIGMQVAKQAGVRAWTVALPIGGAAGVLFAVAYARLAVIRSFATVLSLSAIVVPVAFLGRPGIRRILAPPSDAGHNELRLQPGAPRPGPVVVLVLDEMSLLSLLDGEEKIDPVLFPNIARLARDGVFFRQATSVSDDTRWALPAIVSGRYPRPDLVPRRSDYPESLFTLLEQSHHLEVMESVTHLCASAACQAPDPIAKRVVSMADDLRILYLHILLTDDLRTTLPELTKDWARFGVRQAVERRRRHRTPRDQRATKLDVVRAFRDWISVEDPQPTFYFLHSLLSHSPWEWLPTGQKNATRTPVPFDAPGDRSEAWGVVQYQQRHLMQIGLADVAVGEFIARLEQSGIYEQTLIVVTADHGVAFRPGFPRRGFYGETAAEIMRVPLVIKFPARASAVPGTHLVGDQTVSDRNAETIDIAPTVLDALGLEVPWKIDGASLLRPLSEERPGKRIALGKVVQFVSFGARAPALDAVLRSKLAVFGAGGNPYRVPRPERYGDLMGRAVAECQVADGGGTASVVALQKFLDFRPAPGAAPFDLAGRLTGPEPGNVRFVAVAVNGTIRAVTQTWRSLPDEWLATPPLDTWRVGHNQVEVFLVQGDETRPRLLRVAIAQGSREAPASPVEEDADGDR